MLINDLNIRYTTYLKFVRSRHYNIPYLGLAAIVAARPVVEAWIPVAPSPSNGHRYFLDKIASEGISIDIKIKVGRRRPCASTATTAQNKSACHFIEVTSFTP